MHYIKNIRHFCIIITLALLLNCENEERYYRPDLPEQLCAIGIIDIDDNTIYDIGSSKDFNIINPLSEARQLSFEKSFQSDYPNAISDTITEFSFNLSKDGKVMFDYHDSQPNKSVKLVLPDSLKFVSGKKYSFHAGEKEAPEISAECIVPELPPELTLKSLKTGFSILDETKEGYCGHYIDGIQTNFTRRSAEIEFTFFNPDPESYYAILLTGSISDSPLDWSPGFGSVLLNFDLLETNTSGFFHPMEGRNTRSEIWVYEPARPCHNNFIKDTLYVYFFDGSKNYGENCTFKISAQWDWLKFPPDFIKCFRIRLMSLPKEAYLFFKSLYTYKIQAEDPFSELVNINGNIVGGNGVISLCRSRDLIVYTGQKGGMYDPFF